MTRKRIYELPQRMIDSILKYPNCVMNKFIDVSEKAISKCISEIRAISYNGQLLFSNEEARKLDEYISWKYDIIPLNFNDFKSRIEINRILVKVKLSNIADDRKMLNILYQGIDWLFNDFVFDVNKLKVLLEEKKIKNNEYNIAVLYFKYGVDYLDICACYNSLTVLNIIEKVAKLIEKEDQVIEVDKNKQEDCKPKEEIKKSLAVKKNLENSIGVSDFDIEAQMYKYLRKFFKDFTSSKSDKLEIIKYFISGYNTAAKMIKHTKYYEQLVAKLKDKEVITVDLQNGYKINFVALELAAYYILILQSGIMREIYFQNILDLKAYNTIEKNELALAAVIGFYDAINVLKNNSLLEIVDEVSSEDEYEIEKIFPKDTPQYQIFVKFIGADSVKISQMERRHLSEVLSYIDGIEIAKKLLIDPEFLPKIQEHLCEQDEKISDYKNCTVFKKLGINNIIAVKVAYAYIKKSSDNLTEKTRDVMWKVLYNFIDIKNGYEILCLKWGLYEIVGFYKQIEKVTGKNYLS